MTDDLVKRLREYDKPGITMSEAADRIEVQLKLLNEQKELMGELDKEVEEWQSQACKHLELAQTLAEELKRWIQIVGRITGKEEEGIANVQ